MPNPNIRLRIGGKRSPFDKDALILFKKWDALGVSAPYADKVSINQTIVSLKSDGQWNFSDCILRFDAHNKIASLVNWKNPNGAMATITNDYAGSFTPYVGFTGNGSNFRINTGFNPGDGGTYNYKQNDAFFGFYNGTNDSLSSKTDFSASTVANNNIAATMFNASTPKAFFPIINSASTSFVKIINQSYGWHFAYRTSSLVYSICKNGQDPWQSSLGSKVSVAIPNLPVVLFCRAVNNSTFSTFSSRLIKGFVAGGGSVNFPKLVNGLNKYSLAVGSIPKSALVVDGNSFTAAGELWEAFYSNYTGSNSVADFTSGLPGIQTNQIITAFPTTTGLIDLSGYTKKVYVIQEVTNDMAYNSSNVNYCYNNIVTLANMARNKFGTDCKILVVTCLPRGGAAPITEANRENAGNLFDNATINGKIRNNYASFCDGYIDFAADPIMGVAGAYTNVIYYNVDQTHPTTLGYQRLNTNYLYPGISPYL